MIDFIGYNQKLHIARLLNLKQQTDESVAWRDFRRCELDGMFICQYLYGQHAS